MKERLKSPRLRLFVALDLPRVVVEALMSWQQEAFGHRPDLRMVPKESLHVTLVFLGYQAERDVETIVKASFEDPPGPFDLRPLEAVEVPKRRPRLYAVGLEDPESALVGWQGRLSARLCRLGVYEPEKRPFWPHVTVARVKAARRGPDTSKGDHKPARALATEPSLPRLPEPPHEPFRVHRLTLYRSTLTPQGAIYEPLAELELGL